MNIDKFKQEHAEIMAAVTQLKELSREGIAKNADQLAQRLVAMSSMIKLHLAAEDQYVYPTLAGSSNPSLARLGQQFKDEMGGLAGAYMAFVGRWNLSAKLVADPEGFRAEANEVFKALHMRIQHENQSLYPAVETIN